MKSLIVIGLVFFIHQLNAQQSGKPDEYILVYFNKGVERKMMKSENETKVSTKFKAPGLKIKLNNMGLLEEDIIPSTPDFNEVDTIKVLPNGSKISKLNLAQATGRE